MKLDTFMRVDEHYEVLILRQTGWTLDCILFDRREAEAFASGLSRIEGFAAVKVVYSIFDPESGLFRESDLQRLENPRGKVPGRFWPQQFDDSSVSREPDARPAREPPTPKVCSSPDDLYHPDARQTIITVLGSSLDTWAVTPTELLHLPAHALRLNETGTLMQGAVQKVAIGMSRQGGGAATALIKRLYAVITAAICRLKEENADHTPDPIRKRFRGLAERLYPAKSWGEKIDLLFCTLPPTPSEDDLHLVDAVTAEILSLNGGMTTVIRANAGLPPLIPGKSKDGPSEQEVGRPLIATISELLDILDPHGTSPRVEIKSPGMRHLLGFLRQHRLPDSFKAVLARIARELQGPRFLTGSVDVLDVVGESRAIGDVASRISLLVRANGNETTDATTAIALENRSEALLRPEVLGMLLGKDAHTNFAVMLAISQQLVGELNQRRIAKHLLACICGNDAISQQIQADSSDIIGPLRRLAMWQEEVSSSAFPADLRQRLMTAIDMVCQTLIAKTGLYRELVRKTPQPFDQVLAIVDLAEMRAFTTGDALNEARRRALACVESAGGMRQFASELFDRSLSFDRMTNISRFLGENAHM